MFTFLFNIRGFVHFFMSICLGSFLLQSCGQMQQYALTAQGDVNQAGEGCSGSCTVDQSAISTIIKNNNGQALENHITCCSSDELKAIQWGNRLIEAASTGKTNIVNKLLAYRKKLALNIDARDRDKATALYRAVEAGYFDVVKALVEAGADVKVQPADIGSRSVLHAVAVRGDDEEEMAAYLLDHGANIEAKTTNNEATPLSDAVSYGKDGKGQVKLVRLLITRSANLEAKIKNSATPLYRAVEAGYSDVVKVLVEASASLSATDDQKNTLMHIAAKEGRFDVAQYLLEKGYHLKDKKGKDIENNDGATPLQLAIHHKHGDMVELLLDSCANIGAGALNQTLLSCQDESVDEGSAGEFQSILGAFINPQLRENCTTSGSGGMSLGPVQMAKRLVIGTGAMALPYVETGRQTVTDWVGSGFNEASFLLSHYALAYFIKGYQNKSQEIAFRQPASELDGIDAHVSGAIDAAKKKGWG